MNKGKFYSQDDRVLIIKYIRNQIYNLTPLFFLCQFIKKKNYFLWAIKYPIPNLVDDREKGRYISKYIWKFYFLMKPISDYLKVMGSWDRAESRKSLSPCLALYPCFTPVPSARASWLSAGRFACFQDQLFTSKALRDWRPHHRLKNLTLYSSVGKESACNAGDLGSIPRLGRSPGEGTGYPLQYSCLENSMDSIIHGVTKNRTRLSAFTVMTALSASPVCQTVSPQTP